MAALSWACVLSSFVSTACESFHSVSLWEDGCSPAVSIL